MKNKRSLLPIFVIHKHHATSLHYDLRIQEGSILKSWAIPKGPSTDPTIKRLALQVPDHPISYANFEGVIESGYGAGPVLIWDKGTIKNNHDHPLSECLAKGNLSLFFQGEKLQGTYYLIKTPFKTNAWIFFKADDTYAHQNYTITEEEPRSVVSGKTIEELTKKRT